jgi:alanine-glyoxylate transaminase/(R)-3-amino-2-methylpropionate-pyruvate transaminase
LIPQKKMLSALRLSRGLYSTLANKVSPLVLSSSLATENRTLPPYDYKPVPYNGPTKEQVAQWRKQHLNPGIFHYYPDNPLMVVEGNMQYMYDETGRRYLDLFAGIVTVSVGHSHPKVTKAGVDQMKKIMHTTTIYLHPEIAAYSKELAAKLPPTLDTLYFVNSGSEANDLALLMARMHTGNHDMIALRNCYHGMSYNTMGITALNTWKYAVPQGIGIKHAVNPNPYRGPWGYDDPDAGAKYANDIKDLIDHATTGRVAGFMAESIQVWRL